jgi:hypothetical protein
MRPTRNESDLAMGGEYTSGPVQRAGADR